MDISARRARNAALINILLEIFFMFFGLTTFLIAKFVENKKVGEIFNYVSLGLFVLWIVFFIILLTRTRDFKFLFWQRVTYILGFVLLISFSVLVVIFYKKIPENVLEWIPLIGLIVSWLFYLITISVLIVMRTKIKKTFSQTV
ncbi:hypothetical protein [Mycoplasma crocodyli]|uniref:Transmembrane protein n=1 Tax=Mycoplasma crocodyli (strain ATCC 51981 / MP145) TaxID=512564 RepID=D5E4N7_MYCCM|nr:hypothetical protein [Mycoplasma crocodyli]ADE19692.1 hypothetical protein MCRO_0047 [Mycoplasma crocodyli MP145]